MKRGDRFVYNVDWPMSDRVFVEVTRAAKDGSWVDIACTSKGWWWWSKRQHLVEGALPSTWTRRDWNADDINAHLSACVAAEA